MDEKHLIILPDQYYFTRLLVLNTYSTWWQVAHFGQPKMLVLDTQSKAKSQKHYTPLYGHQEILGSSSDSDDGQLTKWPGQLYSTFRKLGVDFAKPYKLRLTKFRGKGTIKAYLAIFICLSRRAAHIELVEDHTSTVFIPAFLRLTLRCGNCKLMRSEGGTNFVGSDKELRHMSTIIPALATIGYKRIFNPP